ncbi:MAG: pilus assembly protein PilM [Candidatus Omnitrophota bacterium]|nr:pilus assembly protein PilM [Candidatus Omnitrophota bacterium]
MIPLLNNFLKTDTESFVAINLGNQYIKGLVVKGDEIIDFFLKEKKDIPTTLREIWQEKKITTDTVKISLKDAATIVRYFPFPKLEKKKIKQTLFYELNKHIPFPPEEVYFDFSILEELNPSEIFVLLAVAKKEFINNILQIFEKEKMKVSSITLDSICLINLFLKNQAETKINSCILDIGNSFSTLTILKKETPHLTRDIGFGIKDIFNIISHTKNMPLEEIENWFACVENHNEVLELSQDSISGLCKEIKSSFDYFEVNKGERVEKLYLTGGLTYIKNIDNVFKDYLDVETGFLDNAQNLKISFSKEDFNRVKNSFSVALGLVL